MEERTIKGLNAAMSMAAKSTTKGLVKKFDKWAAVADPSLTDEFLEQVTFCYLFKLILTWFKF